MDTLPLATKLQWKDIFNVLILIPCWNDKRFKINANEISCKVRDLVLKLPIESQTFFMEQITKYKKDAFMNEFIIDLIGKNSLVDKDIHFKHPRQYHYIKLIKSCEPIREFSNGWANKLLLNIDSEFIELVDKINEIQDRSRLSKLQFAEKLISRLFEGKYCLYLTAKRTNEAEMKNLNTSMIESAKQFIAEKSDDRRAVDTVVTALSFYVDNLNKVRFAEALNISRRQRCLTVNDYVDEGDDEGDENFDTFGPQEIDDIEEEIEDDCMDVESSSRKRKLDFVLNPSRKPMSNKLDPTQLIKFWHHISEPDNNRGSIIVNIYDFKRDENGLLNVNVNFESHQRRLQKDSCLVIHQKFLHSEYFQLFLIDNPGRLSVGIRTFYKYRCKCIRFDRMHSCACKITVQQQKTLTAFHNLMKIVREDCNCGADIHSITHPINNVKDISTFKKILYCEPCHYDVVDRDIETIKSSEMMFGREQKNILHAKAYFDKKGCLPKKNITKMECIQESKLVVLQKNCADGTCRNICGYDRLLLWVNGCQLLSSESETIRHWKYSEVPRNVGKSSIQLLPHDPTFKQFIHEELLGKMQEFTSHNRHVRIDSYMRRLQFDYMKENSIVIFGDFSAQYDALAQYNLNCDPPLSVLQEVFVVTARIAGDLITEQHSYWGDKIKKDDEPDKDDDDVEEDGLSSNYMYHMAALRDIIKYYQRNIPILENIFLSTDGCAGQYKSKYTVFQMTQLCDEFGIQHIVHTYAPTAAFKNITDCAGFTMKQYLRRYEINERGRAQDAPACYLALKDMPQPQPKNDELNVQSISRRQNKIVVPDWKVEAIKARLKQDERYTVDDDENVIGVPRDKDRNKVTSIPGIKQIYQIKYGKRAANSTEAVIEYRKEHCHCRLCVRELKSDQCLMGYNWTKKTVSASQNNEEDVIIQPLIIVRPEQQGSYSLRQRVPVQSGESRDATWNQPVMNRWIVDK